MSHEHSSTIDQLKQNPFNVELVADTQANLGQEWAAVYGDMNIEADNSAEIILRNPSVYLHDVSPRQLPGELQEKWTDALSYADTIAQHAATQQHKWGRDVGGFEKLQSLVRDGEVKPTHRGAIADIMRSASTLFAESTKHVAGNTKYYAGNLMGAASRLPKK